MTNAPKDNQREQLTTVATAMGNGSVLVLLLSTTSLITARGPGAEERKKWKKKRVEGEMIDKKSVAKCIPHKSLSE
jgi:hypothetical protein